MGLADSRKLPTDPPPPAKKNTDTDTQKHTIITIGPTV